MLLYLEKSDLQLGADGPDVQNVEMYIHSQEA